MLQFDTLSCWIQVDGTPLPEYKVEDTPDGEGITCWIPSEAGKAFQICYSDSERVLTTASAVLVDGQNCGGKLLFSKYDSPNHACIAVQNGAVASEVSVRPFIFSDCQLVDDDFFLDLPTSIGQIVVIIDEVRVHGLAQSRKFALRSLLVHERAKNGIVHGIRLGTQVVERHMTIRTSPWRRIITFVFNYRPVDVLMAERIAPLSRRVPQSAQRPLSDAQSMTSHRQDEDNHQTSGSRQTELRERIEIKQEYFPDLIDWRA